MICPFIVTTAIMKLFGSNPNEKLISNEEGCKIVSFTFKSRQLISRLKQNKGILPSALKFQINTSRVYRNDKERKKTKEKSNTTLQKIFKMK